MIARRRIHAVVPVKNPAFGKSRLAPVLDARERRALCQFLATRTLDICVSAFGASRTIVVTSAPDVARYATHAGAQLVPEGAGADDLNAAIALGIERARLDGADAVLVVPADLALLNVSELRVAAEAIPEAPGCLIVPDRRDTGTNLLGLAPLNAGLLSFGELSRFRHADLATLAGYEVRFHRSTALALDLDIPEDYADWRQSLAMTEEEADPVALPAPVDARGR